MSEEKEIKRIGKDRMDLRVGDLNEDEIQMVLDIGLCFNPKTKKWDGSWVTSNNALYFINEEGKMTLPLGDVYNLCLDGVGLTCLHNFPEAVTHDLKISNNKIKSLEGCPSVIGGDFACDNNMIETLEDLSPTLSVQNFSCQGNKLSDLKGCPVVYGEMNASHNPLTSLKGMPQQVPDANGTMNDILKFVALSTRLKNYAYITTTSFTITSLYKISDHERDFVSNRKVRKKKFRGDLATIPKAEDYVISNYNCNMDEREYYLELANFIVNVEMQDDAEEIWWHEDVLPNIKNLFTSMKTVTKFNL